MLARGNGLEREDRFLYEGILSYSESKTGEVQEEKTYQDTMSSYLSK